jgi:hypothetical protein
MLANLQARSEKNVCLQKTTFCFLKIMFQLALNVKNLKTGDM